MTGAADVVGRIVAPRTFRFLAIVGMAVCASFSPAAAQVVIDRPGFILELPSEAWTAVTDRPDDFVNGDRAQGFLRIRKREGGAPAELAQSDWDRSLKYLSGSVSGGIEPFAGRLTGVTSSYGYTSGGRPMAGRNYYLKSNDGTVHVLHFTGDRVSLLRIRNQTDAIARSFRSK